ncbi:hypothetical protein CHKEEEPN_4976 [Methylorubrum podarium]|nr:hypothetical protein CHKEEEPN_4976 [Methylorubrum podarium]
MQEQRGLVEKSLGRARVLEDDRRSGVPELLLLGGRQLPARIDDDGQLLPVLGGTDLLDQLGTADIGQAEIDDRAVEPAACQGFQRGGGRADPEDLDVLFAQERCDAGALVLVVLDEQEVAHGPRDEFLRALQGSQQTLALDRLFKEAEGARAQAALLLVVDRDHVDRNVPGAGVVLQEVEQGPAVHIGQADVEGNGVRLEAVRETQRAGPVLRDQTLEATLARELQQHRGEHGVVLHDEHDVVARVNRVAVVRGGRKRHRGIRLAANRPRRRVPVRCIRRASGERLRGRFEGHEQGEGAARPDAALDNDLAAQQARDLAADREAEARAAVLAARGSVGLLERLEDDPLLVLGDADPGIGDGHGDPLGPGAQGRALRRTDPERDASLLGELEGVGEKVAQDLLQALRVRPQGARQARIDLDHKGEVALLGELPEGPVEVLANVLQRDVTNLKRHRARLDLGEIEYVVDE